MGRSDLSRHRKTSPSDTPPVQVPQKVTREFSQLSTHSHSPIVKAVTSIKNATTQRAQVNAIKLLGYALRDSHCTDQQNHPQSLKCSCVTRAVDQTPLCQLTVPILLAFIFDVPSATSGLISSSLRALLVAQKSAVPGIKCAIDLFLDRVSGWSIHASQSDNYNEDNCSQYLRASSDICALAAMLGDSQAREWVIGDRSRVVGALQLIVVIVNLYLQNVSNKSATRVVKMQAFEENTGILNNFQGLNPIVLERACDASVKAAQDLINHILKNVTTEHENETVRSIYSESVSCVVESCLQLLRCPTTPRNFTAACAVAYISGMVFICSGTNQKNIVELTLRDILKSLDTFPPFTQLSLLRAIMEAPAAKEAHPALLFPLGDGSSGPLHLDVFSALASFVKSSEDVHLRFLAMDAVISCIRRRSPAKLSDYCREVALKLVNGRMHEPFPGVTSQVREAMDALTETDGGDKDATRFWVDLSQSLLQESWTTRGVYALLSPLLKRIGAIRILQVKPECQKLAMHAIGEDSKLCKMASEWLGSLWSTLRVECQSKDDFHNITSTPLLQCLLHPQNVSLRNRVREYVLPVYLKAAGQDNLKQTAFALLQRLQLVGELTPSMKLRGTVSVLSAVRQLGCLLESFSDSRIQASLREALQNGEEDIRLSALDLIVFSKVSTEPISEEELNMLMTFLPCALMPGGSPADQSRFRHSMRRFMERLAACLHAARDGSGGWWIRERKLKYGGKRTDAFERQRVEFLNRIQNFYVSFASNLVSSIYPGAAVSRRTNALNVLNLLVKNLGLKEYLHSGRISPNSVIAAIVACLTDEWERPRRAALEVIAHLENPTPGFSNKRDALSLQKFALPLLDSVRQRDVDAGACILTCLFQKYIIGHRNTHEHQTGPSSTAGMSNNVIRFGTEEDSAPITSSSAVFYANSVLDSLQFAIQESEKDFMATCRSGLFHGRCLLLRHILQVMPWKDHRAREEIEEVSRFVHRLVGVFSKAIAIAMRGVEFESWVGVEEEACRTRTEDSRADSVLLSEEKQCIRTSCFLSLKELCVAIGVLGREAPLKADATPGCDDDGAITSQQLTRLCDCLVLVFTSTRHWGVIDGASEGLQLITERLLRAPCVKLRSLPSIWINGTLSDALNGNFYVLRRSAGVPFLISSTLSAEASNHRQYHDTPLLDSVMANLLGHLERSHFFQDEDLLSDKRSREEEAVSHALNLLRTLFLNGDLASSVLKYFERAMIATIKAFCSASWLIRNSAMMLYSALVRRGIGLCAERKSNVPTSSFDVAEGTSATLGTERRLRNVTAVQFFNRYPRLHPMMLEELEKAVYGQGLHVIEDHPVLFPILYILSSLSTSSVEDPSARKSVLKFQDVLKRCIKCRSHDIRRVAASASVLVMEASGHIPYFICELLLKLPEEPKSVKLKVDNVLDCGLKSESHGIGGDRSERFLSQNRLHGELTAITAVLKEAKKRMTVSECTKTISILATHLPSRTWIAQNKAMNHCAMTKGAMALFLVEVFRFVQEISKTALSDEHMQYVTIVSGLCADNALQLQSFVESCGEYPRGIADVAFYSNAAELLGIVTMAFFGDNTWSFQFCLRTLTNIIFSSHRETLRQGLFYLRRLLVFSSSRGYNKQAVTQMEKVIQQALHRGFELIRASMYLDIILEALLLTRTILESWDGYVLKSLTLQAEIVEFVKRDVMIIARKHPSVDIREQGLVLVGHVIPYIGKEDKPAHTWMQFLEELVSSEVLASTRVAICNSIARSQLCMLEVSDPVKGELCVRSFLIVARLLEDSNTAVRKSASDALHGYDAGGAQESEIRKDVLPSLMSLFERLGTQFGNSAVLFAHLSNLLGSGRSRDGCNDDMLLGLLRDIMGVVGLEKDMHFWEERTCADHEDQFSLFQEEDFTSEGESILRRQLGAWCCQKALQMRIPHPDSYGTIVRTCEHILGEVFRELQDINISKSNESLVAHQTFTVEGFSQCHQSFLRLHLALCCFSAAKPIELDCGKEDISIKLLEICSKFGSEIHPALASMLYGIYDIVKRNDRNHYQQAMQAVFFLLRVPGTFNW